VKINANVDVIERGGGVAEGRSFTIEFNEKLARMLSKGIYQNVIRAPIRELSCNAIDSHRAAHKRDVPIRVHLPNNLEPYFEVQDEGLGLSDEGIYTLFTCYGGSNKDHSNDDIGGFGLGSKAPFAYTSSFNVTSVYQGVKRHYVMHKDEMGKPHVTPMGEEPTSEHNGVTVRVPVKPTDFRAFCENAQETFKWFDVPPMVTGNSNYQLPTVEFEPGFELPMWGLIKTAGNDYYYGCTRATVVMANVAYPLRSDSLKQKYHRLINYPLVIRFNNGELEPAVSREDLNYDEHTVQVLEMRLDQVIRDMGAAVEARIAQAATYWQARVALNEMQSNHATSDMLRTITQAGYTPKWQGKDVQTDNYVMWHKEFNKQNPSPHITLVSETYKAKPVTDIRVNANILFVLKDCSDAGARCREAFYKDESNRKRVYLIEGVTQDADGTIMWNASTCGQVTKWLSVVGDPETILASSLPKAEKKIMTFKGREWTGRGVNRYRPTKSDNWGNETSLTTAQGGYYVTVEGLTPWKQDVGELDLAAIRQHAISLGILSKTDTIWGINKTNTKLIVGNPAWKEVHGHVKAAVEKLIATNNVAQILHDRTQSQAAQGRVYGDAADWHKVVGHMPNVLGVYVREWSRMSKNTSTQIDTDALRMITRALKITWDMNATTPGVDLDTMWEQIMTKYPLLKHATRNYPTSDDFKHFVSYIEMIDAQSN
jgi:hypothetical protein